MPRSRRELALDRTRQIEWLYYGVCFVLWLIAFSLKAPPAALWGLAGLTMLLGLGLWVWQYRAQDELGRRRIVNSWAVSGLMTNLALGLLVLSGLFRTYAATGNSRVVSLPFSGSLAVLMISLLSASLTNVFLRRRDERA